MSLFFCFLMGIQISEHFRLFSDIRLFSKHQVAGMSKIFSSLDNILITGILADLCYFCLISFALRLDHLIRELVFVWPNYLSHVMKLFSSLVSKSNVLCHEAKKKCEYLFAIFVHLAREAAFKTQISGVVFRVFFLLFQAEIVWQYDWTKHNLGMLLDCILCWHSMACTQLQVQNGSIFHK